MRGRGAFSLGPLALAAALLFLGLPPVPALPASGASGLFAPAPELAPKAQLPLWSLGLFFLDSGARPPIWRSWEVRLQKALPPPRAERRRYLRYGRLLLEGG